MQAVLKKRKESETDKERERQRESTILLLKSSVPDHTVP